MVSEAVLRARWIDATTIHLKKMGLSFDAISEQITRTGRGQAHPIVAVPEGLKLPADYTISRPACNKAFKKAICREPAIEAEEFRKLDTARCEEMLMNLQPGIRKGNVRSVEGGSRCWAIPPKINGYAAAQKQELTEKTANRLH